MRLLVPIDSLGLPNWPGWSRKIHCFFFFFPQNKNNTTILKYVKNLGIYDLVTTMNVVQSFVWSTSTINPLLRAAHCTCYLGHVQISTLMGVTVLQLNPYLLKDIRCFIISAKKSTCHIDAQLICFNCWTSM